MFRNFLSHAVLACIMLIGPASFAATVSWQSSTNSARWVNKGPLTTTAWDNDNANYITVTEATTYQEFFGHGGCFNEVGWKCLMKLSQSTRDSIMTLLFDTVNGCNFAFCRVPIGANDYSIQPYSLNETANDYTMTNFSISHDDQYLLPYMKAATAINPKLKIWGSPWSVPTWMKDSKTFNSGSIKSDAQTFTALALYFAKAVKAYQQAGLHYCAVMPANEPNWKVSMGYPVTGWTASQLQDFIKNYLGPRFKTDDVPGDIYLGTILNDADVNGSLITAPVFSDSVTYSYCTGSGYQYNIDAQIRTKYPDKRFIETETPCGTISSFNNPTNFWNYAMGNDDNMRMFYNAGISVYSQWNIVLDTSGSNIAAWRQYAMIMIDTAGKKVTFTPQFYQVRHYSYVKPGAFRIATSGNSSLAAMAFRNLDGENILILTNKGAGDATVAINFNGQKIKPTIPGSSFNTFRIAGTPIPPTNPFSKVEAEKFSTQSGVLIRPCNDGGSGSAVTLVQNNDWTVYHNVDFTNGAATFEARVSGAAGGSIEVHLDSSNGPASGTCTVVASSAWSTVSCPVTGISGKHTLYLKYKGTATGNLFDLNWFNFTPGTSTVLAKQQSASAENHSKIAVFNGLTMSLPGVAGKRNSGFSVYTLSGKLVCQAQNGKKAIDKIKNAGLRKGIYIIK